MIDSEELWGERLYHLFLLIFFHLPGITQFIRDFWEVHCHCPSCLLQSVFGVRKGWTFKAWLALCHCCTDSLYLQKARWTCQAKLPKSWVLSVHSYRGNKAWNLFQWVCSVEAFLLVFFWRLIGLQRKANSTGLFFSHFLSSFHSWKLDSCVQ